MTDFDSLWRTAVRFRRVSSELETLLHDVYSAFGDDDALSTAVERVLMFLASPAGSFMTGQTIVIDGGGTVGRG